MRLPRITRRRHERELEDAKAEVKRLRSVIHQLQQLAECGSLVTLFVETEPLSDASPGWTVTVSARKPMISQEGPIGSVLNWPKVVSVREYASDLYLRNGGSMRDAVKHAAAKLGSQLIRFP